MDKTKTAPILSRVKSWQLVGLGISGWVALYSAAVISWGASSLIVGNAQGGCFAVTMTLAGLEARRFQKPAFAAADPLQWTGAFTIEEVNQAIAKTLKSQDVRVESPHPLEAQMGFGVRAINGGRTLLFETERWREPVIDLAHATATDENRKKVYADQAIIVGAGKPDEAARGFVATHPAIKFLIGEELKGLFPVGQSPDKKV
ncbi:MAG TPA: hypothetical protein VL863_02640 [bacterium]|jgi:hypothetical protein|nr:hypothetical protein [bacterium]